MRQPMKSPSRRRAGLARALACVVACTASLAAQADDNEKALLLFLQAERAAAKGQYTKARALYARIAKKYASTPSGRVATARARGSAYLGASDIVRHGPSANRVDVVVTGDGYTIKHMRALENIARVVPKLFERNRTLGEYYRYHNFIRANVVSREDGIDAHGRQFDTALGGRQSGSIQGQCTCDRRLVKLMLSQVEGSDGFAIVYVKQGVLGTGGGGVATVGGRGDKTTIHEWGHAFASLSDEYAQTTGHRAEVGIGINVTGDRNRIPWQHWLDRKARGVGVYQGANGQERGAWKPVASGCIMERGERFCPVCREALVLGIYKLVDPIDEATPRPHFAEFVDPEAPPPTEPLALEAPVELKVRVMRPKSHHVQVRWWVLEEGKAPAFPTRRGKSRSSRGPLATLPGKGTRTRGKAGWHRFKLLPKSLEPGRYRVICRAVDPAKLRGERLPWVLDDPKGLLQSERAWTLVVPAR